MATFDLNPYNGNIIPSKNDGLKSFLNAKEERKEDAKLKASQSNIKKHEYIQVQQMQIRMDRPRKRSSIQRNRTKQQVHPQELLCGSP